MDPIDPSGRQRARRLEVDSAEAGQRIDNFLARILKGVPRSRLYRILRKGEVRVNSGRVRPSYRLQPGDQVRIPPLRAAPANARPAPAAEQCEAVSGWVIHETPELLVIDKPAGVAVHGGSGISHGVIERLRAARPSAPYLELVHRLDRETSGCLLIAKRRSTLRRLHELLRQGAVEKRYLALVAGHWAHGRKRIDAPLQTHHRRDGERSVRVGAGGKPSSSLFRPVQFFRGATLVEVRLDSGRTHQIRVHAAHAGHPLLGDERYGDAELNRAMRARGLRRMFLHATAVAFEGTGGERICISAPLPAELSRFLDRLERARD